MTLKSFRRFLRKGPRAHEAKDILFLPGLSFFLPLIFGGYLVVFSLVPPVHRWRCTRHPGNTEFVLDAGLRVLADSTGLRVKQWIVSPDYRDAKSPEVLLAARWECQTPTTRVPVVDTTTVDHFLCLWSKRISLLSIEYEKKEKTPDTAQDDSLGVCAYIAQHPGLILPFHGSPYDAVNFTQVEYLLRQFVEANRTVFPRLSTERLMEETRRRSCDHLDHLWRDRRLKWFLAIASFLFLIALRALPFCLGPRRLAHERFVQARARGLPVKPPSRLRCLFARDEESYRRAYEQHISAAESALRAARKGEERRQQEEERHRVHRAVFEAQLAAFVSSLTPEEAGIGEIAQAVERARNVALPLIERERAYWKARDAAAFKAKQTVLFTDPRPALSREARLLRAVGALPLRDFPSQQSQEVVRCLTNYRAVQGERRESVRVHWLERALDAARGSSEERAGTIKEEAAVVPSSEERHPFIATTDDFIRLLDLKPFLPPEVDHDHAATIILTGLLKPGQRGRAYFNEHYRRAENVRKEVVSRLGARFDQETYDRTLAWLLKHGVVLSPPKKKHQVVLCANGRVSLATDIGVPIVQRIVAFYRTVTRTLHV